MSSSLPTLAAVVFFFAWHPGVAHAKVFYAQGEALELAFPAAVRFERKTYILRPGQVRDIERASRSRLETNLVTLHTAWADREILGYIHIDVHTVRSKPEGLMVVLDPTRVVSSVRVLAFYEPLDYLPSRRWYAKFMGKSGRDMLRVGHDVDAVSGATLTVRSAAASVRRALAYFDVLLSEQSEE